MLADPKLAPLVGNGGMVRIRGVLHCVLLTFSQWTIWTGDTYNVLVYKIVRACIVLPLGV